LESDRGSTGRDGVADDFDGVAGLADGSVLDLGPAGCAGGCDDGFRGGGTHDGKERQLADGHGDVVVLVAEGAGHAAAAAVDGLDRGIGNKPQHRQYLVGRSQRLLVAVGVDFDGCRRTRRIEGQVQSMGQISV
jgi:hypothetical protein